MWAEGANYTWLLGVRNTLNNYFAMYKRLRAPIFAWNSHPPPTWCEELFK